MKPNPRDILDLEVELVKERDYLKAHPGDPACIQRGLMLTFRLAALKEEGETVVTLQMPDWVTFGDGGHEARVLFYGIPRLPNEMSRDDLDLLTEALKGATK